MYRYIHGSEDSTDTDVCYVFDVMPDMKECKLFCDSVKTENRNIICIKDGIVSECYKGCPDEVNNALYTTYPLHEQEYPLLIERKVEREPVIKYVRVVRSVLSLFTKTEWRKDIKAALRGGWREKLLQMERIAKADEGIWKNLNEENLKMMAFQLGQGIGLFDMKELYTKREIADAYPMLKPFLYREKEDYRVLQKVVCTFYDYINSLKFIECGTKCTFIDYKKTIDVRTEKYV